MRALAFALFLLVAAGTHAPKAQVQPAQQAQPAQQEPLKVAPNAPESVPEAKPDPGPGGRANICQELLAFVQKAADPDDSKGQSKAEASRAEQPGGASEKKQSVDTTQERSGYSAPVPRDDATSTPAQLSAEQARSLADANDLQGCQRAVQTMRRSGMALPPGLLALGALREDLLMGDAPR